MKKVKGYLETVIKLDVECPHCECNQVDIELSPCVAFKGNVVSCICEECGKEFEVEVQ